MHGQGLLGNPTPLHSVQDTVQVVLLGDAMDTRPFRLDWPSGIVFYLVAPSEWLGGRTGHTARGLSKSMQLILPANASFLACHEPSSPGVMLVGQLPIQFTPPP